MAAVKKTFSPVIRNAAFKKAGMDSYYVKIPCKPEDVGKLLDLMKAYNISWLNVTIPHKQTIIPYLSYLSKTAEKPVR